MNSFTSNAPVDQQVVTVDRLEKRLEELEEELYKLERGLHFLEWNPMTTVGDLQSTKDRIKNKTDEIEDTKRRLREAQRPPDAPQNDRVDNSTCCICHEGKSRHELFALVPCGHRCVCAECAPLMVQKSCPVCRIVTVMAMRVFD